MKFHVVLNAQQIALLAVACKCAVADPKNIHDSNLECIAELSNMLDDADPDVVNDFTA